MGSLHELPTGTVTLLFCDIEGSTVLARRLRDGWPEVLGVHRALLRRAVEAHGGVELGIEGDGLHAAFDRAREAVLASADAQRALTAHLWPSGATVLVRMGLHTGEPVLTADGYEGLDMHRAARVMAAGHGGQVLLTGSVRETVGDQLPAGLAIRDLGPHALRDFPRPERVFQLVVDGLRERFPALRAGMRPTNVPRALTRLVGREHELAGVTAFLRSDGARLVTLTGPGGVGKTRLAIEIAHELGSAHFVSLASVGDPAVVPATLAQSLGIVDRGGSPPVQALVAALAEEELLLVLDNHEHLLAAAPLITELLAGCPRLSVLVTSREPLRLRGEHIVPVAPLALPAIGNEDRVTAIEQAPATALFVERLCARDPLFEVNGENAQDIAEICRRLDGLALAIELAAARIGLLTPRGLAARLSDALELLGPGTRDAPDRHQTLHATVDWSFRLLDGLECEGFTSLATFRGGCTLEAAQAVAQVPLTTLESLMSKSLLVRQVDRLAMLETVRQYASQRLAERADADDVHRRHGEYLLATARHTEPRIRLDDQAAVAELDLEIDNLRAALAWTTHHDSLLLAELSVALTGYWKASHRWDEGRRWVAAALSSLDAASPPAINAELLLATAQFASRAGFADTSDAREALEIFDSLGDPDGASRCLGFLSADETFRAHWEAADALADQALARSREANDDLLIGASLRAKSMAQPSFAQALPIAVEAADYLRRAGNISFVALVLSTTGFIAITDGAYDQADKLLDQALEAGTIARDVHRVATVRGNQGLVALFENRMRSATEAFCEQLTLCRDSRISNPTLVWEGLSGLAAVAAKRGEPELAGKLVGAASAYVDTPLNAAEAPVYDRLTERFLEPARAALGHAAWDRACREGNTLTLDDAIATGIPDMPSRNSLRPAAG